MVMDRETPPLNRRVDNKGHESKIVPFRSKPSGFESGRSHWQDCHDAYVGEWQTTPTSPVVHRVAGLDSEADALARLPAAPRSMQSVFSKADSPSWTGEPPQKILLATDLSFRCERALDRAAALSAQWQAPLMVLHVLDASEFSLLEAGHRPSWPPSDPQSLAWKRLLTDVGAVTRKATLLMREGDPTEAIVHTAEAEHCDLIVLGIPQDTVLGRIFQDRTIDRLLRRSRVPLLIVKERPRGPYRDIVVATDFSDASRHALEAAAGIFPEQTLTIFHAYDAPLSGLTGNSRSCRRAYREIAMQECDDFLKKVRKPARWQPSRVLIEDGAPYLLLRDYVREMDIDLLVLGMHRRNAIFDMIVGSAAKTIMDEVPCDVLVIREPRDAGWV